MKLIIGYNAFTIDKMTMLKKKCFAVITFTDGSEMKIMYFGIDKNDLGDFLFSFDNIKRKQVFGLKAKEGGLFKSGDDFRYTFVVSSLSDEEALLLPSTHDSLKGEQA